MFSSKDSLICILAIVTMVYSQATVLGGGFGSSKSDVVISGSSSPFQVSCQSQCCDQNRINVNGEGSVNAQPNIAILSLTIQESALTSSAAIAAASKKINNVISILKSKQIKDADISTAAINVYPNYKYENGVSSIIGQIASQTLTVTLRDIGKAGVNVGPIIDSLSIINGIIVNNIQFDLVDKSQAQNDARALAFKDAKKKADDYAYFSGVKVGNPFVINDNSFTSVRPVVADGFFVKSALAAPTQIIAGDLTITASVIVSFQLK